MTTWTALTTLPEKERAEALGEALEDLWPEPVGVGVFELEDGSGLWEVGAYFTDAPDDIALSLLAAAHGAQPFAVSELPETDWVAHVRRELHPVEAGRFYLYGSHDADSVPEGRMPASDRGGDGLRHRTSRDDQGLPRGLRPAAVARCRAAPVSPISARARRFWPSRRPRHWPNPVIASDIDPVAVEVAQANAQANGVGDRVTCIEAAGFDHPDLAAAAPFDLVFANILKGPLVALAPEMRAHVARAVMRSCRAS
jgi:ribosomal protein L11 methyltransferase